MNRDCAEHPAATRTRCSCRRTSSSAARARRACSSYAASCCTNRVPGRARRRHRRLRQPARAPLPRRPGAPRGGRHAGDRRVDPRRAGVPAQGRRSASRRSGPARTRCCAARSRRGGDDPAHRDPRQPRRRAAVDRVVRRPAPGRTAPGAYLHHNFVVALLNDLFGIQSRGGCSCAGPYGHRLLGIDLERSHEFEREIAHGCEGIKPGWVRVNFNYFISEAGARLHRRARSSWSPTHGWRLLPDYRFDPATGLWRHRDGPVEPPLRLRPGRLRRRRRDDATRTTTSRCPEAALAGYLDEAREVFAGPRPPTSRAGRDRRPQVSADFEHLRWFELPAVCLQP